jgi:hypothetical protein
MADFAGAAAAIEARLLANWTTTPVAFENGEAPQVADPEDGSLRPWVFCEIVADGAGIDGFGLPQNNVVRELGAIEIAVFVAVGSGRDLARQYAVQIGEIFRVRRFYDDAPGTYVRTWTPSVGVGRVVTTENPSGNWFSVPVRIPFEFYHRA